MDHRLGDLELRIAEPETAAAFRQDHALGLVAPVRGLAWHGIVALVIVPSFDGAGHASQNIARRFIL